jgi:hypothetical protein
MISEDMKATAVDFVNQLLTRRLKGGGISTSRPETYFQCEAEEPRAFPGGSEVRVRMWHHWSDARCELDADSGQLMAYSIDRFADPPNDSEMTKEEVFQATAEAIEIPADAVLKNFYHFEFASKRKLARLEWERIYKGLRVEGDYLYVSIHPKTLHIVEYARKWRVLKLT